MSESLNTDYTYEDMCKNFTIDVPEFFNFGFDVVDNWARKDRNKLAMIWVNQQGQEKKITFLILPTCPTRQQTSFSNTGLTRATVCWSCSRVFPNGGSLQ
jgi:acetyl-CoA synthetase